MEEEATRGAKASNSKVACKAQQCEARHLALMRCQTLLEDPQIRLWPFPDDMPQVIARGRGRSRLATAVERGDVRMVRRWLEAGDAADERDGRGMTPLMHASHGGKSHACHYTRAYMHMDMFWLKDRFRSRSWSFSCGVSFLRFFAPSVVSSPPPAALLLAAPSLAVLLVLVLRGIRHEARPSAFAAGLASLPFIGSDLDKRDKLGS